jgi:hypothetical protein
MRIDDLDRKMRAYERVRSQNALTEPGLSARICSPAWEDQHGR